MPIIVIIILQCKYHIYIAIIIITPPEASGARRGSSFGRGCDEVLYYIILSTILYSITFYFIIFHILYYILFYYILLYSKLQYSTVQYSIVQYGTVLVWCSILQYAIVSRIILYCAAPKDQLIKRRGKAGLIAVRRRPESRTICYILYTIYHIPYFSMQYIAYIISYGIHLLHVQYVCYSTYSIIYTLYTRSP